jgi:ribosome production factor 2
MDMQKSDASLFMFGNHTKKRPHNLVLGRCFDHHILDMMEFGVDNYVPMSAFKGVSATLGSKPCFSFNGDLFDTDGMPRGMGFDSAHPPAV